MRRVLLLLITLLCITASASAQNQTGYPLPENLQPITPNNITQLAPLASMGSDLPGALAWSPDGKTLAVGTTGGVRAYDAAHWNAPPQNIPGWKDVRFDSNGNLVSDGKLINSQTGAMVGNDVEKTPSGKMSITYRDQNGSAAVVLTDLGTSKETVLDTGFRGTINQLAFSPDEQFAAIEMTVNETDDPNSNVTPSVQLWNVAAGSRVAPLEMFAPVEHISTLGFHRNGSLLVMGLYADRYYGDESRYLYIWDGRTGKLLNSLGPTIYPVHSFSFSPDDQLLAFPTEQGISLWSDHEIGTLKADSFSTPVFSPDAHQLIAYAVTDTTISIWNIETLSPMKPPDKTMTGGRLENVIPSPDGSLLAAVETGDSVNTLRIWDQETGEAEVVIANVSPPIQFSPDSRWILAKEAGSDTSALWDARTGERLIEFDPPFALNPDWTMAARWVQWTTPSDVEIVSLPKGDSIYDLQPIENPLGEIRVFDADGGHILFNTQAFDITTGQLLFSSRIESPLPEHALSADWKRLLKIGNVEQYGDNPSTEASAYVQEPVSDIDTPIGWLEGDSVPPSSTAFLTPDGQYIGYISHYNTFNPASGNQVFSRLEFRTVSTRDHVAEWRLTGAVQSLTFSHDGQWLAFGSSDYPQNSLIILNITGDLSQNQPAVTPFDSPPGNYTTLSNLAYSPDDSRLALAGYSETCAEDCIQEYFVNIWDAKALTSGSSGEASSLAINDVHAPVFSSDGRLLLVTGVKGYNGIVIPGDLQLWDTHTQQQLTTFSSDDGLGAFSPYGQLLAAHQNGSTLFYNLADLKQGVIKPLATFTDLDKPVKQLAFNPAGTILYVLSDNRLWLYGVKSQYRRTANRDSPQGIPIHPLQDSGRLSPT